MPRQGVPYPGREICSLKCQIDALNAKINELMKSINGVQGDGQGNLSLVSGDPAIVINNDAAQNQIEIALDGSQLPAAAVSSVNSQTGAVVLEADDIPSDGNSDVQADIDALKALGVNLQGAIGNEVTARGNADAALQGNINTLQASIPGEAANAVANDPTVQGLVTADAQNVKLGGSQNITGVKTVPTEATGSATQQIANGAKVKNELDAYTPMVRTTGAQTIAGVKTFKNQIEISPNTALIIDIKRNIDRTGTFNAYYDIGKIRFKDQNDKDMFWIDTYVDTGDKRVLQIQVFNSDGTANGYIQFINTGAGVKNINTNFPKPANW